MFTAIVKTENGRVVKFAEFESLEDAQTHCDAFGGVVYEGRYLPDLFIDGDTVIIKSDVQVPTMLDYDIAIERHLDAEAEAAGYYDPLGRIPNIDRACSYAGYVNQYQAESQSFVAWRAAVWAHAFQVKSDVEANARAQPTIEELIAELPARVIPE